MLFYFPPFFLLFYTQKKTVPLCSCENSRVVFSFFFLLYTCTGIYLFFLLQQNVFRLTFVSLETSLVNLFRLDYIQCLYNLSKEFNLLVEKTCFWKLVNFFFLKYIKPTCCCGCFRLGPCFILSGCHGHWIFLCVSQEQWGKSDINRGCVYSSVVCFLFFFFFNLWLSGVHKKYECVIILIYIL